MQICFSDARPTGDFALVLPAAGSVRPGLDSLGAAKAGAEAALKRSRFEGDAGAAAELFLDSDGGRRLIVAGTTPGVLDGAGATIAELTEADVHALTASGTAHSGMVAKLNACRHALASGVGEVAIVAGRGVHDFDEAVGTRMWTGV